MPATPASSFVLAVLCIFLSYPCVVQAQAQQHVGEGGIFFPPIRQYGPSASSATTAFGLPGEALDERVCGIPCDFLSQLGVLRCSITASRTRKAWTKAQQWSLQGSCTAESFFSSLETSSSLSRSVWMVYCKFQALNWSLMLFGLLLLWESDLSFQSPRRLLILLNCFQCLRTTCLF